MSFLVEEAELGQQGKQHISFVRKLFTYWRNRKTRNTGKQKGRLEGEKGEGTER